MVLLKKAHFTKPVIKNHCFCHSAGCLTIRWHWKQARESELPDGSLCKGLGTVPDAVDTPARLPWAPRCRGEYRITAVSHQLMASTCPACPLQGHLYLMRNISRAKNVRLLIRAYFFMLNPSLPPVDLYHLCHPEYSSPLFIKCLYNTTNPFWANRPNSFPKSFSLHEYLLSAYNLSHLA